MGDDNWPTLQSEAPIHSSLIRQVSNGDASFIGTRYGGDAFVSPNTEDGYEGG